MRRLQLFALLVAGLGFFIAGCDIGSDASTGDQEDDQGHSHGPGGHSHTHGPGGHTHGPDGSHSHDAADDHAHAENGPHGGWMYALGHDEQFFAELVSDSDHQMVRVYILDDQSEDYSPQKGTVFVNISEGEETAAYELEAETAEDGDGIASFGSADPALFQSVTSGHAETIKLRVTLDGVPYVGSGHYHSEDCEVHDH